jgi:cation diffusion facilitator family transporter
VAKLFGGLVSGSAAMFAEAAHSLADTTNQGFLLISIALSGREPTPGRPFGHGQERFLWTFMAAIGMFLAGAIFAIGWGVYELLVPPGGETKVLIPFVVLGLSFLAEGTSWMRALRQTRAEAAEAEMSVIAYARTSRDPNVKMVLFEDTAALVGIALAAAGLGAQAVTGAEFWDPLASVLIGFLLIAVAIWMARDAKHLLIGSSARPEERRKLEEAIESFAEVREVEELLTMILGPKALLVAARVDLEDGIGSGQVERLSNEIDSRLQEVVPDVTEVFIDPTPGRQRALGGG